MAERAGSGVEHGGEELLSLVEGKSEAEKIGAAGVRIFFVAGRVGFGEVGQDGPRGNFCEEFLVGCFRGRDFDEIALSTATAFEKDCGDFRGDEGTRGIIIGKAGNESLDFGQIGGK